MRILNINKNDSGQRLDKFIAKAVWLLPHTLMYKFIRIKKIKVNNKRTDPAYILCEGDIVELYINEEFFSENRETAFKIIKPNVNIIFEDNDYIICDKHPGQLCHTGDNENSDSSSDKGGTLIDNIKAYLYQNGEYNPDEENSFAPALCNRIDRNTGGIVIAAKNAAALRYMNEKIKSGNLVKKYICAVHGIMPKQSDTLLGYLSKDSDQKMVTVYKNPPHGNKSDIKKIITKYKVIAEKTNIKGIDEAISILEIELVTGRTHQIRAHLASIDHPLLGDGKYGINRNDKKIGYKYQALYSYKVSFDNRNYEIPINKINFIRDFNL